MPLHACLLGLVGKTHSSLHFSVRLHLGLRGVEEKLVLILGVLVFEFFHLLKGASHLVENLDKVSSKGGAYLVVHSLVLLFGLF